MDSPTVNKLHRLHYSEATWTHHRISINAFTCIRWQASPGFEYKGTPKYVFSSRLRLV